MASPARRPVVVLAASGAGARQWRSVGSSCSPTTQSRPAGSVAAASDAVPAVLPDCVGRRRCCRLGGRPTALADDRRPDLLLAFRRATLAGSLDGSSCLVLGLDDRVVVNHNVDLPLIPASNVKVVTAAVALEVLGPGTTFTTTVVGPAPVDGVIDGDVYLVGGGDPVLSEQLVHAGGGEPQAAAVPRHRRAEPARRRARRRGRHPDHRPGARRRQPLRRRALPAGLERRHPRQRRRRPGRCVGDQRLVTIVGRIAASDPTAERRRRRSSRCSTIEASTVGGGSRHRRGARRGGRCSPASRRRR